MIQAKKWHTILMVPLVEEENGFTVLDVTNPDKPLHLYTVYNNHIKNKVMVMNHLNVLSQYEYIDDTYSLAETEEGKDAFEYFNNLTDKDQALADVCDATGNTTCYKSTTWTFPEPGVLKDEFIITNNVTNS